MKKAGNISRKLLILAVTGTLLATGECAWAAEEQTGTVFNKGVIDGQFAFASSSDFAKYKVWHGDTKTYVFTKDSILNVKSITAEKNNIKIDAPGVILTLNSKDQYGVQSYAGRGYKADNKYKKVNDVEITAKKLILNVDQASSKSSGKDTFGIVSASSPGKDVTVNGDVDIHVTNKYYKEPDGDGEVDPTFTNGIATVHHGRIVINGNVDMEVKVPGQEILKGASFLNHYFVNGIFAGLNYDKEQPGSSIKISGDANVSTDGTGVHAGARSTITIGGGGTIRVENDKSIPHFALNAEEGVIHMNVRLNQAGDVTGAGNRVTKIYGNIGVIDREETATLNASMPTSIYLGLTTADSMLHGIVLDDFKEQNKREPDKKEIREKTGLSMYLQNGATWNNEIWGTMVPSTPWRNVSHVFTGSKLRTLIGGKGENQAGVIIQNNEKPITVENYSGHTLVIYKHDKTDPKKMIGGDFIINKAEKDSMITLRTDNEGMNALSGKKEERNKVSEILNALANKLYYTAYKDGETNLKGKVEIAEGLTAQSASYRLEDMTFKKENGQGQYLFTPATEDRPDTPKPGEEPKPPTPDKPNPPVIYGPKQTAMMRGAKSAMTTTMLSMRDNMTTMTQRLGDIHEGTEDGIWARTYGGKANYDKDLTKTKENFWGVQIGADKKQKSGWHTGISFDYKDGNATYELGGKGDPKLYTLGIYGTKTKDNGEYIDIVAKAGRGQNDYTVYNDMGHKLKGDYKANAIGLSVEYGKKIEKDNMYLTPQIQLSYMKLQGTDYDAISDYANGKKMHVEQDGMTSLVGRIGIAAGKRTDKTDLYLKANLLHEFKGTTASTFSAENEPTGKVDQDFGDTWAELTLGMNHNIDKDKMIYADITKSFGGDYEMEWKANAGIRLRF